MLHWNKTGGRVFAAFLVGVALAMGLLPAGTAQPHFAAVAAEGYITAGVAGEDLSYQSLADPFLAPGGRVDCAGEPFAPHATGFRFRSGPEERACASAVWDLSVPEGTQRAIIVFRADRTVEPPAPGLSVDARQDFSVHSGEGALLMERALFAPASPSAAATPFEYAVQLAGGEERLQVTWRFEDRGARAGPAPAGSAPLGVRFEALVESVEVRFLGALMPGLAREASVLMESADGARDVTPVRFVLPPAWFQVGRDVRVEVFLVARGTFTDASIVLPTGASVPASELRMPPQGFSVRDGAPDAEDAYAIWVPASVTGSGGPGEYVVHLFTNDPAVILPGGLILGLLFIAVPSVLLGVALRTTGAALGRSRFFAALGAWAPAVAGCTFIVIIIALAMSGGPAALSRWPVAPAVEAIFILLAAICVVSLLALLAAHVLGDRVRRGRERLLAGELDRERRVRQESEEALYSVVHDLKLPLIALDHLVRDVRKGVASDAPEAQDAVQRAAQVIEEMNEIVVDMLTFAKDIGTLQGTGPAWVRPAIRETIESLRDKSKEKGARIIVEPGSDVLLSTPGEALRPILKNLIENAIKYGRDSGTLVRISLTSAGTRFRRGPAVLEVADNGFGIPVEDRERVFHLFTRLPDRQGRTIAGTGVGLAAVQRVVSAQGASIEIDDAPEGGALFRVIWPAHLVRAVKEPGEASGWQTEIAAAAPGTARDAAADTA